MQAIPLAVVGAGSFGRHHVRHLSTNPMVGPLVVVDREPSRAKALADQHGALHASSLDDLNVAAAVVAVPTEAHAEVAQALLTRGVHVLVEKPIAATEPEASALVRLAAEAGLVLQVGHVERFGRPFETLAARARRVRRVCARRHNPPRRVVPSVDVVLDLMIHDIDLALTLVGALPSDVAAWLEDGRGEAVGARLGFQNGASAELSASRVAKVQERALQVEDEAGLWRADLAAGELAQIVCGERREVRVAPLRDNLAAEHDDFLAAIAGRSLPRVDGAAGAAALSVANRIKSALQETALDAA